MQKLSACRKRGSSIHFFSSTSIRCIMAIWPAGPPKLMQPSFSQSRNAAPKRGEASAAGTVSACTVMSGGLCRGATAHMLNHRRIGGGDWRRGLSRACERTRGIHQVSSYLKETALGPREPVGATVEGPASGELGQIRQAFKPACYRPPLTIRRSRAGTSLGSLRLTLRSRAMRGVSKGEALLSCFETAASQPPQDEESGDTMPNQIDLSGRFAVVTGGAQGIGRAIVERFLDSGATVAIWDRDKPFAEKTAAEVNKRGK